jgi:hypothetical protein
MTAYARTKSATCPHCARELTTAHMPRHLSACLHNPQVSDRVRAALADENNPGYAVGQQEYELRAIRAHLPVVKTLRDRLGPWPEVCAAFGLQPAKTKPFVQHSHPLPATAAAKRDARDAAAMSDMQTLEQARQEERVRGLAVCSASEIDGGRRVAWMLR